MRACESNKSKRHGEMFHDQGKLYSTVARTHRANQGNGIEDGEMAMVVGSADRNGND